MTERQLRLYHVFSTFDAGGPQTRTVDLINRLGTGFEHFISSTDGRSGALPRIRPEAHKHWVPLESQGNAMARLLSLRRKLVEIKPDLVLTYNWGAIEIALMAGFGGFRIIHAEDGFGPDEAVVRKSRRVLARRIILPMAEKVVVPSRTLFDVCRDEYRLPEEKILLIPNGVDATRFLPSRDLPARRRLGIPDEAVVFGFVGVLRKEKNLPLLLDSFRRADVPNSHLVFVGDGPERAALSAMAHASGLSSRVHFIGRVEDTAPAYALFDVFTMSSSTEQMPVALLEAMSCALPVVVTEVGDCRDIAGDVVGNRVVSPGDGMALARGLTETAAEWRGKKNQANREHVIQKYSAERMLARYEDLYRGAPLSASASGASVRK